MLVWPKGESPPDAFMRSLLVISWLAVLAGWSGAQSVLVVPTGIGPRAGNSSHAAGFADISARAQYLYARAATGFQGGEKIQRLSMRLDEQTATAARNDLDVSVRVSTRAVDPSRLPFARFDLNDGLVLGAWARTRLSLPAVVTTNRPQTFFDIPLAAPFLVDSDGTLCVDVKFTTTAAGPFPHAADCERDYGDPFRRESYGKGCPPTLTSGASGFWVGNTSALGAYTFVRGAEEGSVVLSWIGLQRVDLALGQNYGVHPCSGYTLPVVTHPVAVVVPRGSNSARFSWINPQRLADPSLAGFRFMAQHAMIDKSLRVGFSDGIDIVIGDGKHGSSFVTVYGSSRTKSGFDPDKDDATSFWQGAPILQIR